MTRDILLVRHAHTEPVGADARLWPLSVRGRQEAARLATWDGWKNMAAIATSAEAKAIETAAAITTRHPHIVTVPPVAALGEVDRRGVFVPDYEAAVAAFFATPDDSPCGWEPAATARARFTTAVETLSAPFDAESIAVVAHGLVLSLYLSTLRGGPPADIAHWRAIPFATVAHVSRAPDGTRTLAHTFRDPLMQ